MQRLQKIKNVTKVGVIDCEINSKFCSKMLEAKSEFCIQTSNGDFCRKSIQSLYSPYE